MLNPYSNSFMTGVLVIVYLVIAFVIGFAFAEMRSMKREEQEKHRRMQQEAWNEFIKRLGGMK